MFPERIQLGEWLPDQPAFPNLGSIEARNCVPQAESYRQLQAYAALTDAVGSSETILNAIWIQVGSAVEILAGTTTRLLRLNGASWTVVGSGYSVTSWEFARFGALVYAVAPAQAMQVIDLSVGSPSFASVSGTPEAPPNARRIAVVRSFIVLGDLDSDSDRIQWSGYNNGSIWDANGNTTLQADSQPLRTGGVVKKIVGGPFGYIFQERQVLAMEYIGPPPIFNLQPIDRARGARSGDAVVEAGDRVFFYAQDGFFMLQGQTFTPIGAERVNRWFLDEVDPTEIDNMVGAVDRTNRIVYWGFKTGTGSKLNRLLLYNYSVNKWAYADISDDNLTGVFELRSVGYSTDNLAAFFPLAIDSYPTQLTDTQAYSGGSLLLFAADTSGALGTLTGPAKEATLDTTEFDGGQNLRRRISGVRPIVEGGGTVTVSLGGRDLLSDTPTFTSPAQSLNSVGEAPILSDKRYHRVRLTITGGFTHATAVDVISRPSGRF